MSVISKLRSQLSVRKYDSIARKNHEADLRVIEDLGLEDHFNTDYGTTGVSHGDVAFLHSYIRDQRPQRVIEFGSGKSTSLITVCMERYCWDMYDGEIAFVSMEESKFWYKELIKYLPRDKFSHFDKFVKIIRSDVEINHVKFISGKSYKDTPLKHFDFCFVDGPDPHGTCNMDFLKILAASDKPATALIDSRKTTQMAYAALLGKSRMKRYHSGLCLVKDAVRTDLDQIYYKSTFPENESILRV